MTQSIFRRALFFALWACAGAAVAAGKVHFVQGKVLIIGANGKERPAQKGDEIREGEVIDTGRDGVLHLKMIDGAIIVMRSDSRLKIETYRFNNGAEERGVLGLLKGGFRSITGLIAKRRPRNYAVATVTATIGIRGTDHEPFYIPPPAPGEVPPGPPGTYDKVNTGATFIQSSGGRVELGPNQVGFVPPQAGAAPIRLPEVPDFLRATPPIREARAPREPVAGAGEPPRHENGAAPQYNGVAPPAANGSEKGDRNFGDIRLANELEAGAPPQADSALGVVGRLDPLRQDGLIAPLANAGAPLLPITTDTGLLLSDAGAGLIPAAAGSAVVAGELSAPSILGNGCGIVGLDGFNAFLDGTGRLNLVADTSFNYSRNNAPLLDAGNTSVDGTPINWGIYGGGAIVDEMGARTPERFHFMSAQMATPPTRWPSLGTITYNTVAGFTRPIDERGMLGGGIDSFNATINFANAQITNFSIALHDAKNRAWSAGYSGNVSLQDFRRHGLGLNGSCSPCSNPVAGNVHGVPIGPNGGGLLSSFHLRSGPASVVGSVAAKP